MLIELSLLAMLLTPDTASDCGAQVCVYASDKSDASVTGSDAGTWKSGARMSRKARAKDAKANRKRSDVELSVQIEGGRGSVFIDGRYLAGSGPHAQRALKPGKHEIEVRDGERTIAVGVLTIPRSVAAVALVVHTDRSE